MLKMREQNCYMRNILELPHDQHSEIIWSKTKSPSDVWWQGLDKGVKNITDKYEAFYVDGIENNSLKYDISFNISLNHYIKNTHMNLYTKIPICTGIPKYRCIAVYQNNVMYWLL